MQEKSKERAIRIILGVLLFIGAHYLLGCAGEKNGDEKTGGQVASGIVHEDGSF